MQLLTPACACVDSITHVSTSCVSRSLFPNTSHDNANSHSPTSNTTETKYCAYKLRRGYTVRGFFFFFGHLAKLRAGLDSGRGKIKPQNVLPIRQIARVETGRQTFDRVFANVGGERYHVGARACLGLFRETGTAKSADA